MAQHGTILQLLPTAQILPSVTASEIVRLQRRKDKALKKFWAYTKLPDIELTPAREILGGQRHAKDVIEGVSSRGCLSLNDQRT